MSPAQRAVALALAVGLTAAGAAGGAASSAGAASLAGAAWVNPIQPANRADPIPGAVNGQLDPSLLRTVEGVCQLARGAAAALTQLLADARAQGQALATDSCYRPLSGQLNAHKHACSSGNCACAATPATSSNGSAIGTSTHGWGKAVDFTDNGTTMAFASPGYGWLKANATRYGFSHPGWAEPGGSACPEAWHWEWVGDGGTVGTPPATVSILPIRTGLGYWTVDSYGQTLPFGGATYLGWADIARLVAPVVGGAATRDGGGYLLATGDGAVIAFGDARAVGSAAGHPLAAAVVGMAPSPDRPGYWLVGADGGIFNYGDAAYLGSTGNLHLNAPVVGMAATPTGQGYWLVSADGGIFNYGDAAYLGSTGALRLIAPITGMAASSTGHGYWLVSADGGVFTFGDAAFAGSPAGCCR